MICCWRFRFGFRAFEMGRVSEWRRDKSGKDFGMAECGSEPGMSSGLKAAYGRARGGGGFGMDSQSCECLEETPQ